MPKAFTINHVGLVVPNVDKHLAAHAELYGSFSLTRRVRNEIQRVDEAFITDGSTVLEIMAPLDGDSPVCSFLTANPVGGLSHVCYECDDIIDALDRLGAKAKLVNGPVPDPAFNWRPIAFVFLSGQLVELVQR